MNGKRARADRAAAPPPPAAPGRRTNPLAWFGAAAVAAALVAASFVVPGWFDDGNTATPAAGHAAMGVAHGEGLPAGSRVPRFAERNLLSDDPITSASLAGRKTLLFFSEGVMCQACFEQIKDLEALGAQLDRRGIDLVGITPDPPEVLTQAVRQYGIQSPMIADDDRDMSAAFNTLGKGMHGDTPGHAFALVGGGKVLWYRDYWLPPDRTMYVDPRQVLRDLPQT